MSLRNQSAKISADLSVIQLTWSAWYLSFVFIAYLILRVFIAVDIERNFVAFAYGSSKVYMLILGILSVSGFLTFYVKQGITRKAYFVGAAVASSIVSMVLVIAAGTISFVEQLVVGSADTAFLLGADASWLLTAIVFSLNILVYHMAGWFIGAGFYRFGVSVGMLYVLLAIVFIVALDLLWGFQQENSLKNLLNLSNIGEVPLYASFIGSFLLLGIALWIIRTTTKKIRVKIK